MRIIFAGTPDIAAVILKKLIAHQINPGSALNYSLVAIYTQPDRPQGRGQKLTPSPVKQLGLAFNIPVETPENFKSPEIIKQLEKYQADLMIVCAYGLLLPKVVLHAPKQGCWNIHVSLLPRWRGAAPIQRAIEAGDTETGISIMQMDEGLDTGDILLTQKTPILPHDTSQTLHDRLAILGAETLFSALELFKKNKLCKISQMDLIKNTLPTYAKKLSKSEGLLDFSLPAVILERKIRAFTPYPTAYFILPAPIKNTDQIIKILKAEVLPSTDKPKLTNAPHVSSPNDSSGPVFIKLSPEQCVIQCGQGTLLEIKILQLPGKTPLSWPEVYRGHRGLFIS